MFAEMSQSRCGLPSSKRPAMALDRENRSVAGGLKGHRLSAAGRSGEEGMRPRMLPLAPARSDGHREGH